MKNQNVNTWIFDRRKKGNEEDRGMDAVKYFYLFDAQFCSCGKQVRENGEAYRADEGQK